MQAAVAAAGLDSSRVPPEEAARAAQQVVTAVDNVFGCAAAISAAFGNRVSIGQNSELCQFAWAALAAPFLNAASFKGRALLDRDHHLR